VDLITIGQQTKNTTKATNDQRVKDKKLPTSNCIKAIKMKIIIGRIKNILIGEIIS
jgi:hypothetical protein